MNHEQTPRVLVFSTAYLPLLGGAELAIAHIVKRIPNMRFLIVTGRFSRKNLRYEKVENVEIYRIGIGSKFDKFLLPLWGTVLTFFLVRKYKPAVFWCVMATFASGIAYIINIIRPARARIPIVLTLQEGDSEKHIGRGRMGLIGLSWRLALPRTSALTAISKYLCERARYYGYTGRCEVVPNGVDEAYVSASFKRPPKETLKEDLGIPADAPIILSVSRLVEKNGIDDLLRAFALLAGNTHLVLVGDGPDRKKLVRLAHELGIDIRVHFCGSVNHDGLLRYYRMSDVFCRPSRSEGLGIAFLEAMGAGVPVVATAVGGIRDFFIDGETGVIVRARDPEDIARGIRRVLEDENMSVRIIEQARALVIKKYLWVDIAKKMESVLLDACV